MIPPNTPSKFINRDGTLNAESLVKSYLELEKILHQRNNPIRNRFLETAGPVINDENPYFEPFWNEYPRKTKKNEAEIVFDVACNKVSGEELVIAARNYAESLGPDRVYAKTPVNWLNDETFKDFMPKKNDVVKIPKWLDSPRIMKYFDQTTIMNWLAPLKFKYDRESNTVTFYAPNKLSLDWVGQRYKQDLESALGKRVEIRLLNDEG